MNPEKAFEKAKNEIVGDNLTITSLAEGFKLYDLFIKLRSKLWLDGIIDIVPHYRGEQVFGWNIKSGIYRPPLSISDPKTAKHLEMKAVRKFENVIRRKVGKNILRDIFNGQKHGKDWDLLFQGQHAGIKTTLTDWSALITTALFFATEESKIEGIENSDGQVWCFLAPSFCILGHELFPA